MKYILVLFTIFCPFLKANEIIRWETDYYPNFGRVMITYLGKDTVLLEEDRNSCVLDNFGNLSACTLMAPIVTIDSITLIAESGGNDPYNRDYGLYQFVNTKHLQLSKGKGISKILKIDEQSGGVTLALRLHPNHLWIPDYLKIEELKFRGKKI